MPEPAAGYERIRVEHPAAHVARVWLARRRNATLRTRRCSIELDRAFTAAAADPDVRVIILAADGPDFSAGHDLDSLGSRDGMSPVTQEGAFAEPGEEGWLAFEMEAYLASPGVGATCPSRRSPRCRGGSSAADSCSSGPVDLIVASTDVLFSDPVTAFGVNGGE